MTIQFYHGFHVRRAPPISTPVGAHTALLATPTATSTDGPVKTAAIPENFGHVYHAATAGGLGLLNDGREPQYR